ncbi:response regulator receiver [Planctopirus limnophila DSM 3776]|uniref:Response regulator receiver n=1 Tax=Planctopirus limnophila (strain ATCC 43296 / DSM 3776 / IFAM 1008 / Mu 290) TaxID=521674 RepID=D5SRV4_PLAL2|nr:response regulator [Planctopirus limnophila]ADG66638.1 response regulator receiver [Planctopirus limnophila DSM 3776]
MKNVIRLALVDPHDSSRNALKTLLLGIDMVWLEAECSKYEFFADVIMQTQPNIALIALDSNPQKGLDLVSRISTELPTTQVLVISSSTEGSLILQAMRNGAREFLNAPLKLDDFLAAIDRIQQAGGVRTSEGTVRSSQVIAVAGVSGGIGCTSLAVNLGCALASQPSASVAIIDLDLALGDADVWLDIIPDYTIQDVADNISRLDYALLKRSLTKHECGAFLLPRPVQLDDRISISPEVLRRVIALLKATFTHLVVDISKSYGPSDLAALEVADMILLTTQLDLPSLRNTVRLLQFFSNHEGLSEKTRIVVNRIGLEDSQISLTKALETLGREVFAQIPNDYAVMVEARNNGVPLIIQSPKSRLTKSFIQLAQQLIEKPQASEEKPDESKKPRKGLFSFLSTAKST